MSVPPLRLELPQDTAVLKPVRALLAAWLRRVGVEDDGEWAVIVTELLTNAIDAGALTVADDAIVVEAVMRGGTVTVSVSDNGSGFDIDDDDVPGPSSARGRGLHLIRALADGVSVTRAGGRTRVAGWRDLCAPVAVSP